MVKKVLNVAFWVVFAVLLTVWVVDFVQVQRSKEPIFCLKEKTHKYDDGKVDECIGLGYRIYRYDRKSLPTGVDFAPIFVKQRIK